MLAIIAVVLIAIVALAVLSFAAHTSCFRLGCCCPIGIVAWIKFGPRRSRQ
jgi:hypothetical protein